MKHGATDGPLTRWITEHAAEHMPERSDQRSFPKAWNYYRKSRDEGRAHGVMLFYLSFPNTPKSSLALGEGEQGYHVTVSFGSSEIPYLREWHGPKRKLIFSSGMQIPNILLASLPGTAADTIITLPDTLKPVIANRTILSATGGSMIKPVVTSASGNVLSAVREEDLELTLDPVPW